MTRDHWIRTLANATGMPEEAIRELLEETMEAGLTEDQARRTAELFVGLSAAGNPGMPATAHRVAQARRGRGPGPQDGE